MNFHILTLEESLALKLIFEDVAFRIGRKLHRNHTADERGLTDDLFDGLADHFQGQPIRLPGSSTIQCTLHKPSEKASGADILIRTIINSSEFHMDRFVLVQAKKYNTASKQFNECEPNNTHLLGQINRMRNYAPIFNYIMLYCTLDAPDGNMIYGDFPFLHTFYLPMKIHGIDDVMYHLHHKFPYLHSLGGRTPVVLVQGRNWQNIKRHQAADLMNLSDPLSYFLVEDFFNGKIGHEWDEKILKASGEFSFQMTVKLSRE
jgi:hypothetical protein